MDPVLMAAAVTFLVLVGGLAVLPPDQNKSRTRLAVERLYQESQGTLRPQHEMAGLMLKDYLETASPLIRAAFWIPGVRVAYPLILRTGYSKKLGKLLTIALSVFAASLLLCIPLGPQGVVAAIALTYLVCYMLVQRMVNKRRHKFINMFPDALDMIVRSVKSGYPIGAALKVIAEEGVPPVSTEFQQMADEIAYGMTPVEALQRLVTRIDEPDVRFFAVVLAVQQESGGNLSEVLSNLSNVIRKRRQIRLKLRALSSEGRASAWVLGSLPFAMFALLYLIAPNHVMPLITTETGHNILLIVVGMVAFGVMVIKQIINIEI